jgi:hypothetical protein
MVTKRMLVSISFADRGFWKCDCTFSPGLVANFQEIVERVICMLIQDLVVIFDGMMDEALALRSERAGGYPQSKVEKLASHLDARFEWAKHGCLELIAARNVLTHSGGRWNAKSIKIVKPFMKPSPADGERLMIGFPMLFRYRKAMRTFLNEVIP